MTSTDKKDGIGEGRKESATFATADDVTRKCFSRELLGTPKACPLPQVGFRAPNQQMTSPLR